jgi:hypothetical protein
VWKTIYGLKPFTGKLFSLLNNSLLQIKLEDIDLPLSLHPAFEKHVTHKRKSIHAHH